jgi:hypothetical protein
MVAPTWQLLVMGMRRVADAGVGALVPLAIAVPDRQELRH